MVIKILESAHDDLIRGYRFYESQQNGLGDYFLDCIYQDIESLEFYAGIHQIYFQYYYRSLSEIFPYAIYYKIIEELILVYAVLDTRQNPDITQERLD